MITSTDSGPQAWLDRPLEEVRDEAVADLESRYLKALLAETRGKIGDTARRAGLNARNLNGKMREYRLRKENFRGRTVD